jgi:hypothetical protein
MELQANQLTDRYHFKTEDQFQAYLVKWFSNEFPEYYGCLFKLNNESKNPMFQIATGLIPGASDLVIFANGIFGGLELKLKGKKHKKEHISQQLDWGERIKRQGGRYLMTDDSDKAKEFLEKIVRLLPD